MARPTASPTSPRRTIRTLDDLAPDTRNANRGTDRGRDALDRSLREFGPARSIVIDNTGTIIAGNKTVEHARRLGIPLRVVQTDGRHLIAVQRCDLDLARDPRARELALADNRVGELDLEWDIEMLQRLQADGLDLSAWWTAEEFAALMDQHQGPGQTDENAVIAPGAVESVWGAERQLIGRQLVGLPGRPRGESRALAVCTAAPRSVPIIGRPAIWTIRPKD